MKDLHIAIDLGSSSGRIVVGNSRKIEIVHRFFIGRERLFDSDFWDIIGIFSEIKKGLKLAFQRYGDNIVSIGIDSWGCDYGLLDKEGMLIAPVYHYRDRRTDGAIEEVDKIIARERLYASTGVAFQSYNSIYQLYRMKQQHPESFAAARYMLNIPDLFAYFITGQMKRERTHASTSALYNPSSKDWAWDVIDALGFPRYLFGELVSNGVILGNLDTRVASEVGAPKDIKVIMCPTHDTASAVSWIQEDSFISSGTWSLLGMNLNSPVLSKEAMESGFTNETGADGKITFVRNIIGMWISNECVRAWGGNLDWKVLDKETENNMGYEGYIDPTDLMFMAPGTTDCPMDMRVREYLISHGFDAPINKGEYMIAIYRGLAKTYAEALETVKKLTGKPLKSLRIVGGGSKNRLLNDLTAKETGLKIQVGPSEATAIGNILYQARSCGFIPSVEYGINEILSSC